MIESQIEDRAQNREQARENVRNSWTGDQTILTAVLVIPYEQANTQRVYDKELGRYIEKTTWDKRKTFLLPNTQEISSNLTNQLLTKGIHEVPVYTANIVVKGTFLNNKLLALNNDPKKRVSKTGYLSFGISDTRGITGSPKIKVNKELKNVIPGSQLNFFLSGFHSPIELPIDRKVVTFDASFLLKGMGKIAFISTAKENLIEIQSDWPHPSFEGAFLPTDRSINHLGYTAKWQTGIFSTNVENSMNQCFLNQCESLYASSFGVDHIQSVDIYLKSLRSVKYGLLIVIITFTLFMLYEVMSKNLRIHPISYALTGMALAMFFLLLIALSEHISFAFSYWISAIACSSLISFYVGHISHSRKHSIIMASMLNVFYLILFLIIRSEDHALLSGSFLLFVLLTTVMVITRKIDWYQFGSEKDKAPIL